MLTLTQVTTHLDPFHDLLVDCHLGAAQRLREVPAASLAALNATERANFLHGQVRALVAVGIEERDGAAMTAWNIDTMAVGTDLLVRFKYLGKGEPKNIATEQQVLLAAQQYSEEAMELLALSGIENPPTLVTCGYTLDGLHIARVVIRRDCKFHQPWKYDIYGGEAVEEPLTYTGVEEAKPAVVKSARKRALPDTAEAGEG